MGWTPCGAWRCCGSGHLLQGTRAAVPTAGRLDLVTINCSTLSHLQTFCFTLAGEYLTARLREWTFKAMLRQEMGWFDNKFNSTGALTTRLASDAAQVQGATGSRLGVLFQVVFSLLLSLAIAFAYSWSLTFIIIGFVPLVMAAGALQVRAVTGFTKSNKKNLEEAGKIAVESIENIRTVAGLHREDTFYELYCTQVDRIHRRSLPQPPLAGILYGFSQGIYLFGYAIVFRYGAFQVLQPTDSILFAPFFDIFRWATMCTTSTHTHHAYMHAYVRSII